MCCLQNITMRDYQESVTTGRTDRQTDRQMPDKVIPMCGYTLQATQKCGKSSYPIVMLPKLNRATYRDHCQMFVCLPGSNTFLFTGA